ncbi:MAG: hypothetical protein HRU19_16810 [Pseudobacteriovorax sp.]|nr:hypothetical protein [Pseudobacteriovorax sp.]
MNSIVCALLLLLFIGACSESSSGDKAPVSPEDMPCQDCLLLNPGMSAGVRDQTASYIYLLGVDGRFESSSIYEWDITNEELRAVIEGEAGDAIISAHGSNLILFNRDAQNFNLRTIGFGEQGFVLGEQTGIDGLSAYDPKEALSLSDSKLFLAMHTAGKFGLLDIEQKAIKYIEADYRHPGALLKPTSIIRSKIGDRELLFVSHQSYDFGGGGISVVGGGRVFVFSFDGKTIVPVDVDSKVDGIQGIELEGNTPELSLRDDGRIVALSLCSELTVNLEQCQSRVELIDPELLSSEILWDMNELDLRMNGPSVYADSESLFVAAKLGDEKAIYRLNYMDKTLDPIYVFSATSGGFYGLFHISSIGVLWVTDNQVSGEGEVIRFDTTTFAEISRILMPHIPIGKSVIRVK